MAATGTQTPEAPASKRKSYVYVPIDLGGALGKRRMTSVRVRGDIADRLNIAGGTEEAAMKMIEREGYTYTRYTDASVSTGKQVTVGKARFARPPSKSRRGGGKAIRVPLGYPASAKGGIRMGTINFPTAAIDAVISDWLATNAKTNEPTYFLNNRGVQVGVVAKGAIADLNPGKEQATE